MLIDHRDLVRQQMADLENALAMIDHKMTMYPQHSDPQHDNSANDTPTDQTKQH